MNEAAPSAAGEKALRVKAAERALNEVRQSLERHQSQCPGDHFWAHGDDAKYKLRQAWLVKKDELEQGVIQAEGCLRLAQSLWVAGWEKQDLEKSSYYDKRRSSRLKADGV